MLEIQPVPQGSKIDELRALARRQATYFKYGTSSPSGTILARVQEVLGETYNWISEQVQIALGTANDAVQGTKEKVREEL